MAAPREFNSLPLGEVEKGEEVNESAGLIRGSINTLPSALIYLSPL